MRLLCIEDQIINITTNQSSDVILCTKQGWSGRNIESQSKRSVFRVTTNTG